MSSYLHAHPHPHPGPHPAPGLPGLPGRVVMMTQA